MQYRSEEKSVAAIGSMTAAIKAQRALAVSGIISGILIGLCGALMIKKLPAYKI